MTVFLTEFRSSLQRPVVWVSWLFATLLAALSGPLGSYETCTFPHRLLVWSCVIGLFVVISAAARAFVLHVLRLTDFSRAAFVISALVAVGVGFPVHGSNLINDFAQSHVKAGLFEIVTLTFAAAFGVLAIHHSLNGTLFPAPKPGRGAQGLPRLLQRLDPAVRGDLIAITGRDHYVDVQTTAGTGSLLMRFSDAVSEAEPISGGQVHRSHWVAWAHVTGVERQDGKVMLRLSPSGLVPVSRNHRPKLQARGLI